MITQKKKYQLRVFGISLLLGLSIASFSYLNTLNSQMRMSNPDVFVEEIEEEQDKEILPDMRLIKLLMNKTLDFVTSSGPL